MTTCKSLPLGELADLQAGAGFPPSMQGRLDGELPLAKVGDISRAVRAGGHGLIAPLHHITRVEAAQLRARIFPPGSTVFAKIGEAISQNYRLFTDREAAFDNNVMGAIPRSGVEPRYLFRFLQTIDLYAYSSKTTVPALRKSDLEMIPVPLPDPPEQRRIADILDKADAIRRKRKETIALTDDLLRSTFLQMFGDPMTTAMNWERQPFGSLVRESRIGLVRASSEQGHERAYPYVRMNAIGPDGNLDLSLCTRVNATAEELAEGRLVDGDFLFNTRNSQELVGKAAVFHGDGDYLFNNNILRVRFIDGIQSDYVCSYWQTAMAQRDLESRKSGTTSVFAVYYRSLATMMVPVPPPALQLKFANFCEATRRKRAAYEESMHLSDGLFRSLVGRLFRADVGSDENAPQRSLAEVRP